MAETLKCAGGGFNRQLRSLLALALNHVESHIIHLVAVSHESGARLELLVALPKWIVIPRLGAGRNPW